MSISIRCFAVTLPPLLFSATLAASARADDPPATSSETPAHAATAAAPAPTVGAPGGAGIDRSTVALMTFQSQQRDPTAALELSLFIGFGTGHFYCKQWMLGGVVAAAQVLGPLVSLIGTQVHQSRQISKNVFVDDGTNGAGTAMIVGGISLASAGRLVDIVMAPWSAHAHNRQLLQNFTVAPIMGQTRTAGVVPTGLGVAGSF